MSNNRESFEPRKKALGYVRVSTQKQVDEGLSLIAQEEKIKTYVESILEADLLKIYRDEGVSGKDTENRDGFQAMMKRILDDHIDYVVVYKLSRLSRNAADALNTVEYMEACETHLISIEENLSSEKSGKVVLIILAAIAEMERENIREQSLLGRKAHARQGRWNGGQAPYGYQTTKCEDGKGSILVEDKEEAEVVRLVFKKFAAGEGYTTIAKYLNDRGYSKKPRGNTKTTSFAPDFLRKMLVNPVYDGKIAYGRREPEKVKGKRNEYKRIKNSDPIIAEGQHEAIVDHELWAAVQKRIEEISRKHPRTGKYGHVSLLSGLVVCPLCGHGLVGNFTQGKRKKDGSLGKPTHAYVCSHSQQRFDHECTFKKQYRQELVDAEVLQIIKAAAHSEVFEKKIKDELDIAADEARVKNEIAQVEKKLRDIEVFANKATERKQQLDPADKAFDKKYERAQQEIDALDEKRESLEGEIAELNQELQAVQAGKVTARLINEKLDEFAKGIEEIPRERLKAILNDVIERVEISPDNKAELNKRIVQRIVFRVPIVFDAVGYPEKEVDHFDTLDNGRAYFFDPKTGADSILIWRPADITLYPNKNFRDKKDTVETVSILSRKSATSRFMPVSISPEDLDLDSKPGPGSATQDQIRKWVKDNYGLNVSKLYIAQMKDECGLPKQASRSGTKRQPQCPPAKKEAIKAAFVHFGLIDEELLKDDK